MAVVLPENYGNIGGNLASLVHSAALAVNPLHDLQVALRDKAASDPEFSQHLADIESSSPGTLEALGFDKHTSKAIGKIVPTPARQIQNQVDISEMTPGEKAIARSKMVTGETPGQAKQDELKGMQSQGAIDILRPTMDDGSPNPNYNKAVADEANFRYATGMTKLEFQQAQLDAEATKSARGTDLESRNMGQDVKSFVDSLEDPSKKLDESVMNAWSRREPKLWNQMVAVEMQKRLFDHQAKQEGFRDRKAMVDADNRQANQLVIQSNGAFSKDVALSYLRGDDKTIQRIRELSSGTGAPMKPGEEELYRASQYIATGQEANFGKARHDLVGEINTTMGDLAKRTGDQKAIPAATVNDALRRLAAINGDKHPLEVNWDFKKQKLSYTQDGKELREDTWTEKLSRVFGGRQANEVDTALVNKLKVAVEGPNVDIKKTLKLAKDTNSDVYDAFLEANPKYKGMIP